MAAEQAIQELPANVSAREAYQVDDAAFAARLGLTAPKEEAPAAEAEPAKEEVVEQVEKAPVAEVKAEAEAPAEEAAEHEPEAPAEPEPEKKEPRQLVTKFALFDEQGELEIPDNVRFAFKANGKEYTDVPIDQMVLFAQQGIYNHEKQQKIQADLTEAKRVRAEAEQYQEVAKKYESYYEDLFKNPEFYERAREEYLKSQTPEAMAEQYKRQLRERDQTDAQRQATQYRASFVQNYLVPKVEALLKENPTINEHELVGRWTFMTAPMLVRGEIPANRLADVQTMAENELTHWARSTHLERSAEAAKKEKKLTEAKRTEKIAKREVARVTSPASTTPAPASKPKSFKSANDWFKDRFVSQTEE